MSQLKKMPPPTNVVATGTATCVLNLGETYERLIFILGGTFTKAMISELRVKLNGKVIYVTTGSDLDVTNSYRSLPSLATALSVDFSELYARDAVWQSIGAIGTASQDVQSLIVEIDIAGATNPTLAIYALTSAPKALNVLNKRLRYVTNISAATKWPLAVPFGPNGGSLIKRIYIKSANAVSLEIKRNGVVIHDSIKAVNDFYQTENKKVPQSGWYVFDATVENNGNEMIDTTNNNPNDITRSFEVNLTVSAAETVTYYVDYIDVLGNL